MLGESQNSILLFRLLLKNDLSAEWTASEWTCSEYTERSTALLAELIESVMRIMCSISILVVLETSSLMVNSLASRAVILPARAFENDTWLPSFQKHISERYSTYISDNNESRRRERSFKTKIV